MEASLTSILELALQQGIWAALYIYLFFRMLSENKEREDKYQTIIDRLIGNIEQGIEDIQERLEQLAAKNKMTPPDIGQHAPHSVRNAGCGVFFHGVIGFTCLAAGHSFNAEASITSCFREETPSLL